jgi:hypothetical protein
MFFKSICSQFQYVSCPLWYLATCAMDPNTPIFIQVSVFMCQQIVIFSLDTYGEILGI